MFNRVIVLTSPEFFKGEAEILNQLFEAGLTRLHIRKPQSNKQDVEQLINQIPESFRKLITVHYHIALAEEMNLGGAHISFSQVSTLPVLSKPDYTTSCSIHQWDEYHALRNIDYCFISPVFDSISKTGYGANKALEKVLPSAKNVFALGGIRVDNCEVLLNNGYAGIAVLGYLWEDKSFTLSRFNKLKQKIEAYGT